MRIYPLTVKRNQPSLHARLTALPWREVPVADQQSEGGHGRDERRTLKVTEVAVGLGFPHAVQAIQVVRRRRVRTSNGLRVMASLRNLVVAIPRLKGTPNIAGALRHHAGALTDR